MKVLDQFSVLACLAAAALPAVNAVTLASTTTLACPPVAATSPPAALVCAKTGDVNGAKRKSIRTFKSKSTPLGDDCMTECLKDTTCLSFSYDSNASKTECRLMLKTVTEQQFTPGTTGITWWDRGCWTVPTTCNAPPAPTTSAAPIVCSRDLVLRALYGKGDAASSFCSTYTTAVATAGYQYPSYLTSWSATSSRISSACTCLSVSPLTTSTTSTSTTSSTTTSSTTAAPEPSDDPQDTEWTSSYTWTEAALPVFTSFPPFQDTPISQPPFPTTTQTDVLPPAFTPVEVQCVFKPQANAKYELFMYGPDEATTDFVVAKDFMFALRGDPNFETEEEANAWEAPLFRFSKPPGFAAFDIIMETPAGDRYLGFDPENGNILLSAQSSRSGTLAPSIGGIAEILTTAFLIRCDGTVEVLIGNTRAHWAIRAGSDNQIYGSETSPGVDFVLKATPKVVEAAGSRLARRGKGNWGSNPRCPNLANSWASNRYGAGTINNCGEGYAAGLEDGGFYFVRITCKELHECYGNCQNTWEECNDQFYNKGIGVPGEFRCRGLNWKTGSQQKCINVIKQMTERLKGGIGRNNFNRASSEKCTCNCDNGSICNGQCTSSFTSKENCGACNRVCEGNFICNSARQCDCDWGFLGRNNPNNCGVCGRRCATEKGIICQNGECVCPFDTLTDKNNCGACGNICPTGTHCNGGQCVCNEDQCGNTCLSFKFNPNNCGSCGNVCSSGFCKNGSCWEPPVDAAVCQPKEIIVNGGFDGGMAPWTGPDSTGRAYGNVITDARSPPDSPNSLQIILPTTTAPNSWQFADIGQAIDICVNQKYSIRFSARVEKANQYNGACEIAVLVPGQEYVVRSLDIRKQEYTDFEVQFTSDQGVVTEPMFWQSIVAPDGANGRSTVTWKILCQGGSNGGALIRVDSFSIVPI
ncbi:hypothetical protein TWF730_006475 [Orbilia blumenaviensis]|uniref:Apple domain-containing protein n=1 Tax=Orbilia blumenaviensis TaxID=1796055 RepID=A0AAV9VH04_9PEZI